MTGIPGHLARAQFSAKAPWPEQIEHRLIIHLFRGGYHSQTSPDLHLLFTGLPLLPCTLMLISALML